MKKAFSVIELLIAVIVLGILLAIGIPAVSQHKQDMEKIRAQNRTHPELSQEEKDRLQQEGETAARERAEINNRENQQSLLNRIQQEEQTELQIQQEYVLYYASTGASITPRLPNKE